MILFLLCVSFPSYTSDAFGIPLTVIDDKWFENDSNHIQAVVYDGKLQALQKEIKELKVILKDLESKGIKGRRGYTIYLPEQAKKQNFVKLAILARQEVIKAPGQLFDILKTYYYEKNFVCGEALIPYEDEENTNKFDYQLAEKYLDSLSLPDKMLAELKVYVAPFNLKNVLGVTSYTDLESNNCSQIILFKPDGATTYRHSLIHEVGHVVGQKLSKNSFLSWTTCNDFYGEYAKIYGKFIEGPTQREPQDSNYWANSPEENFAEDFVLINYQEERKLTAWDTSQLPQVKTFLQARLNQFH